MGLSALVVDDSSALRRNLTVALERLPDMTCVEANDGAQALQRFARGRFDILLTDINMPLMDGLKLVRLVRSQNERIPIVVISTEAGQSDREKAMRLGANAYLVKPVRAQQVIDTVRALLEL